MRVDARHGASSCSHGTYAPRLAGLFVLASVACASKQEGPRQWHKACEHARTQRALGSEDVASCVAEFEALPRFVANDFARCALGSDEPAMIAVAVAARRVPPRRVIGNTSPTSEHTTALQRCLGRPTLEYLDDAQAVDNDLSRYAQEIERIERETGARPRSLTELTGFTGRDAWGSELRYEPNPDADITLCSAGLDRRHESHDDLCWTLPFIYFRF
ncbi:MAG: hypothetical protein AAF721_32800 [Myxococcota bacterium]